MSGLEELDARMTSLIGIGALAFIVLVLMMFTMWRSRRARIKEETETEGRIQEGIDRGDLAKNPVTGEVYPTCIICRARATNCAPRSGISLMDQLPLFTLLDRLYCLSPRYTIEDNEDDGPQYCKPHYSMAVKKLEQFHSELRAQSAKFVADQADKVSHMDAGGLQHIVRAQYQKMDELLREGEEALAKTPQLPPAEAAPQTRETSSRAVLSIVSSDTDDGEGEVEEEAVANDS